MEQPYYYMKYAGKCQAVLMNHRYRAAISIFIENVGQKNSRSNLLCFKSFIFKAKAEAVIPFGITAPAFSGCSAAAPVAIHNSESFRKA